MSYFERLQKIKLGQLPKEAVAKARKPIAKLSEKKKEEIKLAKETNGENALDKWFDEIEKRHFTENGGSCMECKLWIPPQYARHATAHLLPKKIFKSVATHPLNYLILGAGCGCHDKTHTISKFIKMKTFPLAKERILQMMPLLPTDELRRISNQLLIALDMTEK